jgi:tetratricopeptide (TPR) repeat protein
MADVLEQLTAALADRYAVERELGRGGMATVYLAQDLKHHRPVAIKVLKPELAAALGPDRFLREIEVTAGLHHPHILPLFDSGRTGGQAVRRSVESAGLLTTQPPDRLPDFLFYVMPFVEGESLRDRLERERQLPLEEALQLTREVAEALSYAHSRGVIHRDIKPENILLEGGHALVADFGIAKAVTAAGGERLTTTGISIGTPAYMSPEQASGTDHLDGRSDLYSLGCVLYEMLAGHPPFTGTTAHELLARHATDPVPPLRTGRATIPEPIEAAVERVLSKVPADRFATAQQFSVALQIDATVYRKRQRTLKTVRRVAFAAAGALLVTGAVYGTGRYRAATEWKRQPVDPNIVAVLPFQVTAASQGVRTLDEGMQHLLFAVLTGDVGPRAVDVGSLLRRRDDWQARGRWRAEDAPVQLAASFGAGLLLDGAVVEVGQRLLVNALLRRAPSGEEVARASIEVAADSLQVLPQRLLVQLLGGQLGESAERLATLAARPPTAVSAYLAGSRALRESRYEDAVRSFSAALEADSSFALAALRLVQGVSNKPVESPPNFAALRRILRSNRASLGKREQAAVDAWLVVYPTDTTVTALDRVRAARAWVDAAPDDPEAWMLYALVVSAIGPPVGPDWEAQHRTALLRAWERDSTTTGALDDHMQQAVSRLQDAAWLRRVGGQYLAHADTNADYWGGYRWAGALATGDSAVVRELRGRVAQRDSRVVRWWNRQTVYETEHMLGLDHRDTRLLLDALRATRLMSRSDSSGLADAIFFTGIDEGQSQEVVTTLKGPLGAIFAGLPAWRWGLLIDYSLVHPGFEQAAPGAAESLRVFVASRPSSWPFVMLACHVELHRASVGDTLGVRDHVRALVSRFLEAHKVPLCPTLAEALVESWDRERRDTPALDTLAAMLWRGEYREFPGHVAPAVLTRLLRQRGRYDRALAATQLHPKGVDYFYYVQRCPLLKEEGDLAAIVGDTTRAIAAYRRYLELRTNPDEGMRAEVDAVRAALDALLRAKG